jgi:ABC-type transport system substrate-binding protein
MAQVIQQNLGDIGITVKLRSADAATTFGAFSSGEYQLAIFSNNSISPDAADPAWYITATETMFTGYPTEEALEILNGYAATADPEKKKAAIAALQDLWSEQVPWVALAHTPALEAVRAGAVHDAHVSPWGVYYFDTIWKSQ